MELPAITAWGRAAREARWGGSDALSPRLGLAMLVPPRPQGKRSPPWPSARRALATGELLEQVVPPLSPRMSGTRIHSMFGESIADDLSMPIWHGNLVRCRCDAVPERLDVSDLLIGRQLVEAWPSLNGMFPRPIEKVATTE